MFREVFGEFGLVSGRIRRGRFSVGMCSTISVVSERVRRCRLSVGTCSKKSCYCRDVFGEYGLVSGRVRLGLV